MIPGRPLTWPEAQALQAAASDVWAVRIVAKQKDPWSIFLAAGLDALTALRGRLPIPLPLPETLTGGQFLGYHSTYPTHIAMAATDSATEYVLGLVHELGHWAALRGLAGDRSSAQDPYRLASGAAYVQLYATGDRRDLGTVREVCAHAEFDAECGAAELRYRLTGTLLSPEDIAARFCGPAYLLREQDLELGRGLYRSRATSILAGMQPLSPAARWAVTWLQTHAPETLASDAGSVR